MTRTLRAAAAVLAAALALAACEPVVNTSPDVTNTITPKEERQPVATPPEDPRPAVVWPLTGLSAEGVDANELDRSALSIKIENSHAARPQTNLDKADIVWETEIDYGISRLIAVFHSDYPKTVGPIRSMRPHDTNIIGQYRGPLIFSGAQRRFIYAADKAGQDLLAQDIGSTGFFRVSTNYAPHNLHGYPDKFNKQARPRHAPDAEFHFAYPENLNTAAQSGKKTDWIDIYLSPWAKPNWKWNNKKGEWLRWDSTAKHVTADGTQIHADNIIVLNVEVKFTSHVKNGISVPETLVAGKHGKGWVAADNKYVQVRWSKKNRTSPFVLTTLDGDPVFLKPGQTWVELVPRKGHSYTGKVNFK